MVSPKLSTLPNIKKKRPSRAQTSLTLGDTAKDRDQIFVFQVIHDLRHPLEAQKAINTETLHLIKKKRN